MDNSKQSKQILLSVIGVAILVVAVVGVSFAFFNYTRTGTENSVSTGKIDFLSTQSGTLALRNVFPITAEQLETQSANGYTGAKDYGEVVVTVQGNTTYSQGIDYLVTAAGVDFTSGESGIALPVNVEVTPDSLGNASTDNALARTTDVATGNADKVITRNYTSSTPLTTGDVLAKGHIATDAAGATDAANYQGATRINGTLTIKCYLDASKIAISDTLAQDVSNNASTPASGNIQVAGYVNGTAVNWVNGRLVLTTAQWNALTSDTLKFSVKVEAIETGGRYVS